jgi:hypothetical protein
LTRADLKVEETSWLTPLPPVYLSEREEVQAESARLSIVLVFQRLKLSLLSSEFSSTEPAIVPELTGSANGIGDPEELKGE